MIIPIMVANEKEIHSMLKSRSKEHTYIFTTFFRLNPYMGKDKEEFLILLNAANKFQDLVIL